MSLVVVSTLLIGIQGIAVAGGTDGGAAQRSGLVTAQQALSTLTGIKIIEQPPMPTADWQKYMEYMQSHNYTYAVTVKVGGEWVRVMVTPSSNGSSDRVNTIMAFVESKVASAGQREALVRVALGFLNVCLPSEAQPLTEFWRELIQQEWNRDLGWQTKSLGSLKIGWSGENGMNVGNHDVAGLDLRWSPNTGRCSF